jgi:hypothetical protein
MLKIQRIKPFGLIVLILFCLLGLSVPVPAQKKPVKKAAPKAAPKPVVSSFAIKEESLKVANQIKNISRFVFVLGGTARTIEDIDKDPKASPSVKEKNRAAKQTVLQTIRDVRAGMAQLEGDFHAKPELRPFIVFIQGVSETAGIAEDQATAGQLNTAGKTLLEVVNKLTDTLQNLP